MESALRAFRFFVFWFFPRSWLVMSAKNLTHTLTKTLPHLRAKANSYPETLTHAGA